MKMVTVLCFLLISSFTLSEAREPAVEPVTGISIDDYKIVPPSKAKGYDFQKGKPKDVIKNNSVKKFNDEPSTITTPVESKTSKQLGADAPALPVAISLFVLVALPFGIWFGIMKSLDRDGEDEVLPSNTITFPTKNQNESVDDDDYDLPKAG